MTGLLSERLAELCGYTKETATQIHIAACTHDIGKCKIPQSILEKPDRLTEGEYNIMKLHTVYGSGLVKSRSGTFAKMSEQVAMYHHERYDGRGYWGMSAEQLPLYVKIVTLADVFASLLVKRVYKPAWPFREVVNYIRNNAGSLFDPHIVELFLPIAPEYNFSGLEASI